MARYQKGDYDKAIQAFELALSSDLKNYGQAEPNVARTYNALGLAWDKQGNYDQAIKYHELAAASAIKAFGVDHNEVALASNLKTFGEDHSKIAQVYNNLGLAWYQKGEDDRRLNTMSWP